MHTKWNYIVIYYYRFTQVDLHHFNCLFPGIPGLASCSTDSQSSVILFLSVFVGQAKTLHTYKIIQDYKDEEEMWNVNRPMTSFDLPIYINCCDSIQRGFEAEVLTGQIPFLSPNQQCSSTEGSFCCRFKFGETVVMSLDRTTSCWVGCLWSNSDSHFFVTFIVFRNHPTISFDLGHPYCPDCWWCQHPVGTILILLRCLFVLVTYQSFPCARDFN